MEVTEKREDVETRRVKWDSDDIYRLTDESVLPPGGGLTPTWQEHFEYNDVGNRLLRQRFESGALVEEERSTHDGNNRLLSVNRLMRTWDENGNLKRRPDALVDNDWDEQDRLTYIEDWSFEYDADGLKWLSMSGGPDRHACR